MTGEHEGRVALVIGGSSGIGRAAVLELARQGAAVTVHGYDQAETEAMAEEIRAAGGRAVATSGPIEWAATTVAAVDTAIGEFGRLDGGVKG